MTNLDRSYEELNKLLFENGALIIPINANQNTRGSQSNTLWTITITTLTITRHGRRVCRRELRRNEVTITI